MTRTKTAPKGHPEMIDTKRFVDIRGYVREVVCLGVDRDGNWIVEDGTRKETVPEHLFFHETGCGLILRGSAERMRKWPDHPLHVFKLPAYVPR
jgi:hypothetical protein